MNGHFTNTRLDVQRRHADAGRREAVHEVLNGESIEVPAPSLRHQQLLLHIGSILDSYVSMHGLGEAYIAPTDVRLSPLHVVQPDVFFISTANTGMLRDGMNVQGAPDLCVEMLSPGTRGSDLARKRDIYARFGVREYWIVEPDAARITALTPGADGYVLLGEATGDTVLPSDMLPRLRVGAATLFPPT